MNEDMLLDDLEEGRETSFPCRLGRPLVDDRALTSRSPGPELDALPELDCSKPGRLRPMLAALLEMHADRFDPAHFRFIESLAQKALKQRSPVARALEKKALLALRDYLAAYLPAREHAISLVARLAIEAPEIADRAGRLFNAGDFGELEQLAARSGGPETKKQGELAVLTRELLQPGESREFSPKSSFEDELRQQEREFMQSVTGATAYNSCGPGAEQAHNSAGELCAMRYFRESLCQRNSARRVERATRDGPENPGPLNAHALVVRSLSVMRNLSPAYTNRLVSYMETLLWLERAGTAAAPAKPKGAGRRKS